MSRPSTLRSSLAISVAVMASRVLGVLRDGLFAALFGANRLTDAFRVGFRIPNLLRDLFAEGALSSAFVPTFTDALGKEGKQRAFELGNRVLTGLLLVTGLLAVAGWVFSDQVVGALAAVGGDAARNASDKLQVASSLARIMIPLLPLISASAVFMGMLNAQGKFTVPAFAPALFNVVSIGFGASLLLVHLDERTSLTIFAVGTTLAGAVQGFCQLPSLWRSGYRPKPVFRGMWSDPGVRRILRLMAPATLGLAAVQVNVFVNTGFALALGDGPLSCMENAFRLFYLPIGLFGVALGTVTTTRVSEEAAKGNRTALAARTADGGRAVLMLATASSVGLIVLAEPVVALLFQRGRFSAENTALTARILQAYMLGVTPYSLVKIYAPSFYAVDRPRIPMTASMVAVAANLLFNALMHKTLGAPGLALGTTLAALVNLTVLRASFARVVTAPATEGRGANFVRLLAANAALGLVAWGGWRAWTMAVTASGMRLGTGVRGVGLLLVIAVAFALYAFMLARLRYPGADELARIPGKIARRFTGRR